MKKIVDREISNGEVAASMKNEPLCLKMRNKNGRENETYCRHYRKRLSVYLRGVFFSLNRVFTFTVCVIFIFIILFADDFGESVLLRAIPYAFAAVCGFCYLFMIFKDLWFWKYAKHVVVTDEGIWIMVLHATRGTDFKGKRHPLAPSWSLYSWSELKGVSKTYKSNAGKISRIIAFFESFDNFVIKSSKHATLYLYRWDGVQRVDFLTNADAEEILGYAGLRLRNKRKKKASAKKPAWNKTVEAMRGIFPQYDEKHTITDAIYSPDGEHRFTILKTDDNFLTFRYESLQAYDDEELKITGGDTYAYWASPANENNGIFDDTDILMRELKATPEYKTFFGEENA